MVSTKAVLAGFGAMFIALQTGVCQVGPSDADSQLKQALLQIERLTTQMAAQEARIQQLEGERGGSPPASSPSAAMPQQPVTPVEPAAPLAPLPSESSLGGDAHDHMVQLPGGGPALKIRGFFDFNFGMGTDSNPLIFPLQSAGHTTFQSGEFDLFFSSKLSRKLSFVGEVVIGSDQTNAWGVDIERVQLTYKANKYLELSGGRYHTSIGYYNTAYHHGTWFQTVAGRPFMYFYEDSGGLLPVHGVGVTSTGLVPGTGSLGLHWIAEVSNGHSSDPQASPVQNFVSDRTSKAYNVAAYIKPDWAPGLQIGGSFFADRLYPPGLELTRVSQRISSAYVVYNNSVWEFMGEGVLLSNTPYGTGRSYNSPLSYAQISHKFGTYRPYVRYQYVNSIAGDPVNSFTGRYEGPSIGLRDDISEYAALKVQYNLLRQRLIPTSNGLLVQMAFTF